MKTQQPIRPHQVSLLTAAGVTAVGLVLPVVRQILLPLTYLNTHLHEFSHALVAIGTGAQVQEIVVRADGSGVTPVMGGNLVLVASAGYTGASLFGAAMIYFGRSEKGARTVLWILAGILTFSMLLWVRGDAIGVVSGLGWIVVLSLLAFSLKGKPLLFAVQFLGLQQCLAALQSLLVLVQATTGTEIQSDASILQDATHIPSVVWALGWSGFSLALVLLTLRKSWAPIPGRA